MLTPTPPVFLPTLASCNKYVEKHLASGITAPTLLSLSKTDFITADWTYTRFSLNYFKCQL